MLVLWIALILAILTGIILSVVVGLPQDVTTPSVPPVSCAKTLDQLPDVSDTTQFDPCFLFDSDAQNTSSYYDKTNDWTVTSFLSPQAVPPASQVCMDFCQQVQLSSGGSQLQCVGQGDTYQSCLSALFPTNCTDPANPVARSGSTFYYAIGRGKVSCYPSLST